MIFSNKKTYLILFLLLILCGKDSPIETLDTQKIKFSITFSSGSGGLVGLDSKNALGDNIFEVIQVPYPIFIAVSYNVTFWTQYLTQMNQIQEILLSNI